MRTTPRNAMKAAALQSAAAALLMGRPRESALALSGGPEAAGRKLVFRDNFERDNGWDSSKRSSEAAHVTALESAKYNVPATGP